MATQYQTALRTAQAQALCDAIANGSIKFFSGSVPANCAAADPATTLATGTLPATAATASSGVATKSGTWSFTGAVAAGAGTVMTVFRVYNSSAACIEQGSVGPSYTQDWAAGAAVSAGARWKNGANVYLCTTGGTTAGSGGPTGTGTGINDNGVIWNYLGAAGDMGIDNTSIASGQAGSVTTWSRTMPGA